MKLPNVVDGSACARRAVESAGRLAREIPDLIVMGPQRLNALGGLLAGSGAQRVAHLASGPVLKAA